MSKSKYNGVDPVQVVEKYGSDAVRLYILFKAPYDKDLEWDENQIVGQQRFLNRIEQIANEFKLTKQKNENLSTKEEKAFQKEIHTFIRNITEYLTKTHAFNVAISELHKYTNTLWNQKSLMGSSVYKEAIETLPILMAPITPKFALKLYKFITGTNENVHTKTYPKANNSILNVSEETTSLSIHVNGRFRGQLEIPTKLLSSNEKIEQFARESKIFSTFVKDIPVKRVIIANNGKLINFVI